MIVHVMTWDWKEQVDIDDLAKIVSDLTNGKIHIVSIDTDSDTMGLAISDEPLTQEMARYAFDRRWDT